MHAVAVLVWYHRCWGGSFLLCHPPGCLRGGPCYGDYARTCYHLACLSATCQSTRHNSRTTSRQAALVVRGGDPRILGTAFFSLSSAGSALHIPLPMLSLALSPTRQRTGGRKVGCCVCVCKCPRVCLFFPFCSHSWMRQPARCPRRQAVSGEEICLPVAPSLYSLLVAYKEKVWTSFYLLFRLLFDSRFYNCHSRWRCRPFPVHSFYELLSPFFFSGKLFLLCRELDFGASVMMHSG